jgi:hypothetical protein
VDLGVLERHQRARQILCVDPAPSSQMVTVSSMLPIGFMVKVQVLTGFR